MSACLDEETCFLLLATLLTPSLSATLLLHARALCAVQLEIWEVVVGHISIQHMGFLAMSCREMRGVIKEDALWLANLMVCSPHTVDEAGGEGGEKESRR